MFELSCSYALLGKIDMINYVRNYQSHDVKYIKFMRLFYEIALGRKRENIFRKVDIVSGNGIMPSGHYLS